MLNCVLAVLQIYGATSSLSYSLFATMADSIFDPFSNVTLWITHRAAKKINEAKYPAVHCSPRPLSLFFYGVWCLVCMISFGCLDRGLIGRGRRGCRQWGILCFRLS